MNKRKRPNEKPIFRFWHFLFIALGAMAITVHYLMKNRPDKIEYGYSRAIYPYIAQTLSLPSKLLPGSISVSEILASILSILIITAVVKAIYSAYRRRESFLRFGARWFMHVASISFGVYFFFWIAWGANYLREPYPAAQHFKGKNQQLNLADYKWFAGNMADLANRLSKNGTFRSESLSRNRLDILCNESISRMIRSSLDYHTPQPPPTKTLISNIILDVVGVNGFFCPFLMEPHVNAMLVDWTAPYVMAHEKAHFMGFASKVDATIIAYLACLTSDSDALQYSAALQAFLSAVRRLPEKTRIEFEQVLLSPKVKDDVKAWRRRAQRKYDRPFQLFKFRRRLNDLYLKTNSRKSGISSYDEALPHVIRWWKQNKLNQYDISMAMAHLRISYSEKPAFDGK